MATARQSDGCGRSLPQWLPVFESRSDLCPESACPRVSECVGTGLLTRVLTTGLDEPGREWNQQVAERAAQQVRGRLWTSVDLARETRNEPFLALASD